MLLKKQSVESISNFLSSNKLFKCKLTIFQLPPKTKFNYSSANLKHHYENQKNTQQI